MSETPNPAIALVAGHGGRPATPPLTDPATTLDPELRLMRAVARRLPDVPHVTSVVNRLMKPLYLRRPRSEVVASVLNFRMRLNPEEAIDGAYLFYPHLHDRHEVHCLREFLREGDTFVDVGAHIGFYSLLAATAVGSEGRVLAIEAEKHNHARLVWNVEANGMRQVRALRRGVSPQRGTRKLAVQVSGNRGGSSFSGVSTQTQEVECAPLHVILAEEGVVRVRGMKLDIEGEEIGVLTQYFAHAPNSLWPDVLIVEDSADGGEGEIARLMGSHGYELRSSHVGNAVNRIFVRRALEGSSDDRPTRGDRP